jgi:hypothetical protein
LCAPDHQVIALHSRGNIARHRRRLLALEHARPGVNRIWNKRNFPKPDLLDAREERRLTCVVQRKVFNITTNTPGIAADRGRKIDIGGDLDLVALDNVLVGNLLTGVGVARWPVFWLSWLKEIFSDSEVGGDRKALAKELGKSRAMATILATQSAEMRAKGKAIIQQADKLLCESWNERMWSDGEPIDPSPTIDQAVNGGFPWLEIRCRAVPSDVDLAAMKHPPTTFVHDLASRLRRRKCAKAGRRPSATLLQLAWQPRHPRTEA